VETGTQGRAHASAVTSVCPHFFPCVNNVVMTRVTAVTVAEQLNICYQASVTFSASLVELVHTKI